MRYRFRLDKGEAALPDPASRFQPEGPHAPSEIVDPGDAWTDGAWREIAREQLVIYEMHVGTFTSQGAGVPPCANFQLSPGWVDLQLHQTLCGNPTIWRNRSASELFSAAYEGSSSHRSSSGSLVGLIGLATKIYRRSAVTTAMDK
jgi:hypothetical protein